MIRRHAARSATRKKGAQWREFAAAKSGGFPAREVPVLAAKRKETSDQKGIVAGRAF